MDTDTPARRLPRLGWVQQQILLTLLDRYRVIEASAEPDALATLATRGIRCATHELIPPTDHPHRNSLIGHAAQILEQRQFIARGPVRSVGSTAVARDVRLLPAGREHAEALAILREVAPGDLAGPIQKPRQPDPTTEAGPLWHGLEPELAAQANRLLATLPPADTLALGMLLVRESIARGARDRTHRATLSVEEVAALVKVSAALVHLEISRGALQAAKIGHVYRITPQELQAWLDGRMAKAR